MPKKRMVILLTLVIILWSCHTHNAGEWEKGLSSSLKELGHRNWILIADSAYPSYSQAGAKIILTENDYFTVLKSTLRAIQKAGHIRPILYLDKELDYLSDKQAPGIAKFRKKLDSMLDDMEPQSQLHSEMLKRMAEAAETYAVLVLKTNMKLPYTSLFIELDCGYWSPEEELRLRRAMAKPKIKQK